MPNIETIFPPGTIVKLLTGVPLDNTYRDTRDWASQQAQIAWFSSKVKSSFTDFTYQRQSRTIRVPVNAETIYDCNYVMYQNASYGVKWFFAFITQIDYINDVTSEIHFQLDVIQTWYFNFKINPCFVEREHVNDDTPGKHLIDEGLALGDYITNESTFESFQDFLIVVGSTVSLTGNFYNVGGGYYGGIYSGVKFYAWNTQQSKQIDTIIEQLATAGKADAIVCMYELPEKIATKTSSGSELQGGIDSPKALVIPTNRTLDGYTPRNGKLYTYPYQALMISNHDGNAVTYRYEFFTNGAASFAYISGLQPNSRIICFPQDYKGVAQNFNEAISLGNFPQACWQKDLYGQWLATSQARWGYSKERNIRNMLTNLGGSLFGNIGRGWRGTADTVGDAIGEVNNALDIASKMQEENEVHSMQPNSVSGTIGNGYTQISVGKYGFMAEAKSITNQIARSIDGYFDMFGYKVNALKVPNITGRPYWNYVKTINAAITGSLPVEAMAAIRKIFDRGITFWHGDWVGDYSLPNSSSGLPDPPNPPTPPVDPPTPPDPSEPTGAVWGVPFPDWASHVTSEYGPRINPITGVSEVHEGIDIAYPIGTPIAAIAAGTCIRNTSSTGRGNYGTVQVNDTYLYIYQHCSTVNMKVGDSITLEQADVARVGDTGYVTGPHLHLEIWANGTPVNPRPFLEGQFNPK